VGRLAACFVQLDGSTVAILRGCSDAGLCCKVRNASQTDSTLMKHVLDLGICPFVSGLIRWMNLKTH